MGSGLKRAWDVDGQVPRGRAPFEATAMGGCRHDARGGSKTRPVPRCRFVPMKARRTEKYVRHECIAAKTSRRWIMPGAAVSVMVCTAVYVRPPFRLGANASVEERGLSTPNAWRAR